MKIAGFGGKTYLYVNGLLVNKSVTLGPNIKLLPAELPLNPSIFYEAAKSEFDLGMIMLCRHTIRSQMEITEEDPKELAICAFNSIWDLVLISAFWGCEAICNFQCNQPAESITKNSDLLVTNYHMFGITSPVYEATNEDLTFLEENISAARLLLSNDRFRNAVHCLASYRWHTMPNVQLAIIWSGIESIFEVEAEISFRISLYIAKYLQPNNGDAAEEVFRKVKKLYKERSIAVHGSKSKNGTKESVDNSADILRRLIKNCVIEKRMPNTDALLF